MDNHVPDQSDADVYVLPVEAQVRDILCNNNENIFRNDNLQSAILSKISARYTLRV